VRLRKTSVDRSNEPIQDRGHITAARRSASAVPAAAAPREPNKAGELDLEGAPPQPSPEDTERFNAEMAHELAGAQRPGVRSRFPQPLPAFEHTRAQLEVRALHSFIFAPSEVTARGVTTFKLVSRMHGSPGGFLKLRVLASKIPPYA
jgi:hypothetical protein